MPLSLLESTNTTFLSVLTPPPPPRRVHSLYTHAQSTHATVTAESRNTLLLTVMTPPPPPPGGG
jgi:hypothetical protein